ncbi:TRAP transporter large permease [Uliginosibacterium sp. H1]|uniref:TRAP transporter large permease n=1 Tax=Uliginosibacterium sp. H1 TaxID=3114757 RepID=UPI002E187405|nr:TRAP transporter large permease [Uliginosibacterium sp. H1]
MSGLMTWGFVLFALLGMPLSFAIGMAALGGLAASDIDFNMLPSRMVASLDSFPLLSIPLFMAAGELMIKAGLMEQMIAFANAFIGRVRGGLAQVAMLAGAILSAVSGSAVSDASALASTMHPSLKKNYDERFSTAVIAASANLGPIIPPSGAMIVYAFMAGPSVSVGGLFMAGTIPGILLTAIFMFQCWYIAKKRNYPLTGEPVSVKNIVVQTRRSFITLLMPIVCIGGIVGGVFTATEGAGIGVVFALCIGFFVTRTLKMKDLPEVFVRAALMTAVVGAMIAFASTVTFLMTVDMVPQQLSAWMKSVTTDPLMFNLLVAVVLLLVGTAMESNAAYIMLVPLLHPLALQYGIDPLLFGFLFVYNLVIGMLTPPVGVVLFVVSGVTKVKMGEITWAVLPFIASQYALLLACMLYPPIVTWLPKAMGY